MTDAQDKAPGTEQKTSTPRAVGGKLPQVIAITSGKGGVGKTNVTANLAYQLSQSRRKVLILDADLGLANIDIVLGLAPKYNMSHVLSGEKRMSEVLVDGPGGVKVLPASSGVMSSNELTEEQKMDLLAQLEEISSDYDYILIDTSAGITGNVVYFALAAQLIMVILTPEPTSLTDAYALIKVLSTKYRQTEFKIVANEVVNENEALAVYKRITTVADRFLNVSLDFLGWVPRDPRVREAVRAQKPFAYLYPASAASKAIKRLAREVMTLEHDPVKSDLGLLWRNVLVGSAA